MKFLVSVYERGLFRRRMWRLGSAAIAGVMLAFGASAQPRTNNRALDATEVILEAKEAFQKRDFNRLSTLRQSTTSNQHPLAIWVAYWELFLRLPEAQMADVEAFYRRWPGSYLEDRLRNDWLLELGKRRDWPRFAVDYPRFRLNDDKQVTCYALWVDQQTSQPNEAQRLQEAVKAWIAQREVDDGCNLMATNFYEAKLFTSADVWRKVRFSLEANRPAAARQAAQLLGTQVGRALQALIDNPSRYLKSQANTRDRTNSELAALALTRLVNDDPENVERLLKDRWEKALPHDLASWVWTMAAKQAAIRLLPKANAFFDRAEQVGAKTRSDATHRLEPQWPEETMAWKVRAALRVHASQGQWEPVLKAIDDMSPQEQSDPTWVYWKARALKALSRSSKDRADHAQDLEIQAQTLLNSIAGQLHFYGKLATEELGRELVMPAKPAPLTEAEQAEAKQNLGLQRALLLIGMGLRSEGVREWNFSIRGMGDRQLLAAAQLACNQQVWDRCINTSDRTKSEIDLTQRFPMPFRKEVVTRAREIGLDAAYVYGLIRQESRFIIAARSHVGASGLMQVMPATASWTARKLGIRYTPDLIADRDTNIAIGTGYLKLVLDDMEGSQPMAAAAYNAGPSRPRRWREGPQQETAIWAENIPFSETRDYVKKVMSNATYYAALLSADGTIAPSLKARLGAQIGPRDARTPVNKDLL